MSTRVEAQRPHVIWWLALPLLPAWAVAFYSYGATQRLQVATIGAIAIGSAIPLMFMLWHNTTRVVAKLEQNSRIHFLVIGLTVLACGICWVWLQYVLNPFRMRSALEALMISRSAPWQFASGLFLFGSVCAVAILGRRREGHVAIETVTEPSAPGLDQLTIRLGTRTILVQASAIERLQACDDHVAVYAGGRRLLASYRLAELASRLDQAAFVRVHRSHIVNLSFVESIQKIDANRDAIVMKSGERVNASRSGSAALRGRLRRRSR